VARHIFQACPVWIYTQSYITQASLLQVVNSLFQTCYNNWEQAVRTQLLDSM
jgi:hypothetical protein